MMSQKAIGLYVISLILYACNPFEYHPYDLKLDAKYKNINQRNMERLNASDVSKDTIRFAFMGDTQRWYDETELFVRHVNARDDIDFVVHGGDISDFGMKKEFCWIHDIMSGLKVPYVAVIGNHDNLGSGREVYEAMYGVLNFSFVFGRVKFICLNTNALEFDYSTPVPDFEFLKNEIADTIDNSYDQSVVVMHAPPGDMVFNNNVKDPFHEYLKRLKNLRCCLFAHIHHHSVSDLFGDGTLYYSCDDMKGRNYLLFTITKKGYSYEVVTF